MRIVVMGVSGCGKSTVGRALADRLGLPYIEGDALHSDDNKRKMAEGIPLTDEDRWPWLDQVGHALAAPDHGAVAACSALKKSYRDRLRSASGADLKFIFLYGSRDLLQQRMETREGHFMPPALLESQLATLENPTEEPGVLPLDVAEHAETLAEKAVLWLEGEAG
ncbi:MULTISPECIES: gluconokinase [Pseudovibrio]|uniref:gluconokinase n=1 Tax=Stappiaceae TaxID=2821832 RepID=UPI00236714C4|nr:MULTISPECIES: gluconokinase [Pseudovibrio]MDD7910837.1 gluconokinase [Pseudovibrio exalbescens]MDX5593454.1 gluconokinase [Pseudovibrio sp. SPO723]